MRISVTDCITGGFTVAWELSVCVHSLLLPWSSIRKWGKDPAVKHADYGNERFLSLSHAVPLAARTYTPKPANTLILSDAGKHPDTRRCLSLHLVNHFFTVFACGTIISWVTLTDIINHFENISFKRDFTFQFFGTFRFFLFLFFFYIPAFGTAQTQENLLKRRKRRTTKIKDDIKSDHLVSTLVLGLIMILYALNWPFVL